MLDDCIFESVILYIPIMFRMRKRNRKSYSKQFFKKTFEFSSTSILVGIVAKSTEVANFS